MKSDTDVLVVGAGPVGLMLAGELQRRRIDHHPTATAYTPTCTASSNSQPLPTNKN